MGDVIAGRCDYFLEMTKTDAQKELERIEQELNAKAAPPADESRIARVNRKQSHLTKAPAWLCPGGCLTL